MIPEKKEPIAVIGSACRFPGESSSPSKLWNLLREPRDVLRKIPVERFNTNGVYHPDGMHHGSTNVRESYLLSEDYRHFDAQFFKIKPVEAHSMDPQQRLLLETVYESLDSAGQSIDQLRGSNTAVYVGLMSEEYGDILSQDIDYLPTYFPTATARSIMSNRISYVFDWHGPCMTIDTACSSSLVAVHQAVQALRNGDSPMAVAAGSNLCIGSKPYISENKLNMLSPGSRSRMWDADADGYARGDGVAAVILKPLSKALEDGDHIECLIRESGVNQDGRTQGITMPSEIAQEKLIRDTYAKAGLDITKWSDRPQFFEAHGTGTPAGDPIEAEAIKNSFFRQEVRGTPAGSNDTLYVGSIKTVIGHTEGTAGIAALMKASLAMQHGVIPPNMLFNKLSPKVAPFYGKLQITTAPLPWPSVAPGQPKRASVNSFGFGGTNAHVILESYEPDAHKTTNGKTEQTVALPFTFSAATEKSLASYVQSFAEYLEANKGIDLSNLAYTLNFKRTAFPYRRSFSATTVDTLLSKIRDVTSKPDAVATVTAKPTESKILGVFTGQGAQWPTMGRELVQNFDFARKIVDKLQGALDNLPVADRPTWTLLQQLQAEPHESQLGKATISQPLCTVVQVILVDMLRLAGVEFSAVVGHSSGEIAAAYAAGLLSAEDSVKIAYYRGVHSGKAGSKSGAKGAMMAVGTTLEDAEQLCELEDLAGRIAVAACNSSSSVTLSGDLDAIDEAEMALKEEGKFVRKLKVDTAYHSHHMLPCAEPYTRSLEACAIQIQHPSPNGCVWFSSVTGKAIDPYDKSLRSKYWCDNMTGRVNFAQAVTAALETQGNFGAAIEVGPHPALQGPALQTIQEIAGDRIPYVGAMQRGKNDTESFADALGFALAYIPEDVLTLRKFADVIMPQVSTIPLKDLPSYAWEHDRVYWMESRLARAFRTRDRPVHELLGTLSHDGSLRELRWRNVISPKEVPWLHGHKLQGQIVFPGAGYVSMAIEAAMVFAGERNVRLLEVRDLAMGKAMVFEDEQSTADVQFTLVIESSSDQGAEARFHLEGTTNQNSQDIVTFSTGVLSVEFGDTDAAVLPPRSAPLVDTVPVDTESFYTSLLPIGYEYSESFKALTDMRRTTDAGTAFIRQPAADDAQSSSLLVHPGVLDCAIQAVILALCWPGDNRLWSLHVPNRISCIRLNPTLLAANSDPQTLLPVDALLTSFDSSAISGDVDFYAGNGQQAVMQLEGVSIVPFSSGTPDMDAKFFYDIRWDAAAPDGALITRGARATKAENELATLCERVAYYYIRTLMEEIAPEEWDSAAWYFRQLQKFSNYYIGEIESGRQEHSEIVWKNDTREQIYAEMAKWPDNIDLRLMRAVGENLVPTIRGQTTILEHMMHDNVLNDFYVTGLGLDKYTDFLSNAVLQLAHRYANMDILEIGAGTGGVTKTIIRQLGKAFNSYTYTDISSGFFEKAQEVFRDHSDYMTFKVLDAEKDPVAQGFQENSYDLVVCSLVLHATENLEKTLINVRRLLKPGGYLAMLEITNVNAIRIGFSMGGLPGWWLGHKDNRELNPCVPAARWDAELRNSGFAGIDTITPEVDTHAWLFSVILAQATDQRVEFVKDPLSSPLSISALQSKPLIIIGGVTPETSKLVDGLRTLLGIRYESIFRIDTVEQFEPNEVPASATILSLTELDDFIFKGLTAARLDGLRRLFEYSRNVLWVTKGARSTNPYAAMIVGFSRTLTMEMPHVRLQLLHHEGGQQPSADKIAEALIRLDVTDAWEKEDGGAKFLWTTEPEITLEDDRVTIPRLYPSTELNSRYNSVRRTITKPVDLSSTVVGLAHTEAGYTSFEVEHKNIAPDVSSSDLLSIRLAYTSALAIRVSDHSSLFLAKGKDVSSGKWLYALVPELASDVLVPQAWTVPADAPTANDGKELTVLGLHLVAQYIVGTTPARGTLLLHDPSPVLAQIVVALAAEQRISCVITTTSPHPKIAGAIYIHPRSTSRMIKAVVPAKVDSYADFSWVNIETGRIIANIYPPSSFKWTVGDIYSKWAIHQDQQNEDSLLALRLWKAASSRQHTAFAGLVESIEAELLSIKDMASHSSSDAGYVNNVIDWTAQTVPVNVGPVDNKISFKSDRTYLLFGLSGQLGRSLTLYMARHGAKHIVLTSRKPNVDAKWLDKTRELGVDVRVLANDITNQESVRELIAHVRETMPPIAGVANGAMVLQDTAITDMTVDIMNRVLAPKVDGSRYLDELFQHNHELDFFILLSSIATICGQHGQSNYTSANMFLNGLAAQRRRKGLVGSVMAIGAIMGIGYFSREVDEVTRERVIQAGYRMMSERDFHILFAETVLAGKPESDLCELVTGLREIKKEEDRLALNPMFHHVVARQGGVDGRKDLSNVRVPLKTLILAATEEDEARNHIKEAFLYKLQIILQLEEAPKMDSGAEELGIDSLVAVEIRSWFLKELSVDIPVLKILGGATVEAMVEIALEKLPAELTPNLKRENAEPTKATAGESTQTTESGRGENTPPTQSSSSTASSSFGDHAAESALETPHTEVSSLNFGGVARKELMSYGQSRFWFMSGMLEDQTAFNIVFVIQLKGTVDVGRLRTAVRQVAYRHATLRTRFVDDDEADGLQEVLPDPIFQLESRAVSSKEEVDAEFARLKAHEYDLAGGDVMQISLLSQNPTTHWLAVGYHHINMDSMSLQVMLKDIDKAYRGQPLSRGVLQYPEFAARQRAAFQQGRMKRELDFWQKEFPDLPPVLPLLPFAKTRARQPRTSYAHNRVDVKLTPNVAAAIKTACSKYRITPFHFHLAAFQALLTRLLQIDDICIGMTDANRTELDELESLGLYLNMLPLRFRSKKGQHFAEAIKEAQTKVRNALANSRLPFDVLMEQLKPERSMEYSPVFQTFIDYKPPIEEKPELFRCKLGTEEYDVGQTAYDIMLSIVDDVKEPATVIFQVQKSLYSEEEAEVLMKSYVWLLEQFGKTPDMELEKASLHAPEDVKQVLSVGRGPIVEFQWPETISHRVQQMMDTYNSSPAVVDGSGTRLSYRDLDARVNCVAQHLIDLGAEPSMRIPVLQEPSIDWVVSFLAILKIGAVYVPLDLRSPPARLGAVLQDSAAAFLLTHAPTSKFASSLTGHNATVVNVSPLFQSAQGNSKVPVQPRANWPGLLLYTSGTTGVPKGAILKHAGILNQLEYSTKLFGVEHGSRVLQQTAATFDLSIWEVFLALATGGCLVVASSAQRSDPAALVQLIVSEAVTFTMATPSEYAWWFQSDTENSLKNNSNWTIAAAAGEVFPQKLVDAFKWLEKPGFRAFNAYGPCEATLSSNITPVNYSEHTGPVGIGRAIQNMATYIVDEDLNLLPVGLPGEIMLAGVGIAERYISEAETRKRFLPDKWASPEYVSKGWVTMYRTGDRGRMHDDGTVLALGRISGDTQVKINGQRLELQDIEQNIVREANCDLTDAVVSVRGEDGAEFLVAHVSFAKGRIPVDQKAYFRDLISNLALPQYMKPSVVVALDSLPVTKHFKLDRGAISRLPLPDAFLEGDVEDGMTGTALKMKKAWEKVLPAAASRHHKIIETSDFFHVGGTSMRLVRLQREVKAVLGVQLSLPELFQHSTLGEMVGMIEAREAKPEMTTRKIDWEQETAISYAITKPGTDVRPPSSNGIVALTGATGFLGRTILRHLVSNPSIIHIHCLAIRGDASRALPPQFSSPKVTVHYGDLTAPNLGLSEDTAKILLPTLSAIIHNAADVSFMKSYHSLRPINVGTTQEVARLALTNLTPIHYISTAGVAHLSQQSSFGEVSAAPYQPPTDGSDGYTASKWASEVHLERVSAATGLPIWIHRPSSIMGDDPAPTDMMANMLKYTLRMRAVPLMQGSEDDTLGLQAGFLDLVDVENVADGIVKTLTNSVAKMGLLEYLHHCGEMVLPIESIRGSADGNGTSGLGFEVLTLGEWTEKARKEGLNELVAEFLSTVEGRLGDRDKELRSLMMYPRLLKGA